jgi:serine/threonine protein kinase/TolB-like protein/Tfp pilus assembly protein PilF
MKPERWVQVEQLCQAALDHQENQRAAFLDRACAGDEALRQEVDSLLKYQATAKKFIEVPALDVAARAAAAEHARSLVGQQLSHYEIMSLLGAGGMGEVYLARDSSLGRQVALKLLPPQFTQDRSRLLRFKQEARATSALNHPNIITIHEIGEVDGRHYIATEFINGETLRRRIERERIELSEAVEITTQVASALSAAHEAGIIHRDIKPENIMVRPDGYVKVLDFGLAKLTELQAANRDTQVPGAYEISTDTGVVMGTVRYMSPEQARGLKVDARSDIFSLGVVLYEMITGRAPFVGATPTDVIISVVQQEPSSLSSIVPEVSVELERVVTKALRKDREGRYQTAKELLVDLRGLKQEVESGARSGRSSGTAVSGRQPITKTGEEMPAPTTEGTTGRNTSSAYYFISQIGHHKLAATLVLLLIAAVSAAYFILSARGSAGAVTSIAVLPLANGGGDPDGDYLSDGITESIINSLSQLSQLRVITRPTAFRYKGRDADPQKVGHELGVRAVLTGRVVQRGETLSIQAELTDVTSGAQLWGNHYDRKVTDVLAVQEEIAKQIAEKLRLKLTSEERQRLARRYTENTEAYQLYLRGRFWEDRRTEEGFKKAIGYFNQAIENDPNYALAWTGLAGSYGGLSDHGFLAPKDGFTRAKDAVKRALTLDDQLAEAHTELAADLVFYDWDFAGAEPEYKRAIDLNPNSASGHYLYGSFLSIVGRHAEAVAEKRRARDLEPSSVIENFGIGWALCRARQYEQAIESLHQTLEMDRNFGHTYRFLGLAYLQRGMYDEAIGNLKEAVRLAPEHTGFIASLGCAYGRSGRKREAEKLLADLEDLSRRRFVGAYDLAMIYAGLGDKDKAFAQLDLAYAGRSNQLAYLTGEPAWETLRSDARFAALVRRVGLAP